MTSSIDTLTGMPMPALASSQDVGSRPNAAAATSDTARSSEGGGGFSKLMHLQQRGRDVEAKLGAASTNGSPQDPAATAAAQQAASTREQFHALAALVGDAPGGNARRAFAAIVERLEGGGRLQPGDRARIRLAIAADQRRVDLPAALRAKSAILSAEDAIEKISAQATDPSLVQDPARLASFRAQGARANEQMGQVEQLIESGNLDPQSLAKLLTTQR